MLKRAGRYLVLAVILSALPVLMLRWIAPGFSAFMLEDRLSAWFDGRWEHRLVHVWRDLDSISTPARLAVIASEDQLFARHAGFDFNAISKAIASNLDGRRIRGASTISQQTAKNLFLSRSRSWLRKGLEAYFTLWLELLLPKRRILEIYLNVAQFGDGLYGIEAAARHYFKKTASSLDTKEAALLAASLPNPLAFKPDHPSAYMIKRRNWIMDQMRRLGPLEIERI